MAKLTEAQRKALAELDAGEDIICDGMECWIGERQTNWRLVDSLLRCLAISDASDVKGAQRFVINGTGQQILARPALAAEIATRLRTTKAPFSVRDGQICEVSDD